MSWHKASYEAVLIPTTSLSVAAFAVLMVATRYDSPTWTLFASALLAASMPSMPAMVRARWTELYRDTAKLNTAFAFESVADELVYMAGSVLAVGLSVALFPEAGPLASTLALFVSGVSISPTFITAFGLIIARQLPAEFADEDRRSNANGGPTGLQSYSADDRRRSD